MSFLDDLEARPLECGAAGRGQLCRREARDRDPAMPPELGMDEHRKARTPDFLRNSLHPGDVVPVPVAEDDRLDVLRRELEPTHVLHHASGSDARVEEDRPFAPAGRDSHERREARLGDQRVG